MFHFLIQLVIVTGQRVIIDVLQSNKIPVIEVIPDDIDEDKNCVVCFMPSEAFHKMPCNHEVCVSCRGHMLQQNIGNGCVGQHTDTGIKVICCPICRKKDTPTQQELITEIIDLKQTVSDTEYLLRLSQELLQQARNQVLNPGFIQRSFDAQTISKEADIARHPEYMHSNSRAITRASLLPRGGPLKLYCNNRECKGLHRSKTVKRCRRGCGKPVCMHCNVCIGNPQCQPVILQN